MFPRRLVSTGLNVGGRRCASWSTEGYPHSRPLPDVGVTRRGCCKIWGELQVGLGRVEEPFEGGEDEGDGRDSGRRDCVRGCRLAAAKESR